MNPGSPYYIQNTTSPQTSASFNVDGNGTVGGTLTGNTVNASSAYQIGGTAVLRSANQNTFVGSNAGQGNTGNSNILLGAGAGNGNTTGSSDIVIGNPGGPSGESHTIRIGIPGGGTGQQNATFIAGISGATSPSGINVLINTNGQLGTTTSSRRFKENILDMGSASSKLFQLRPVTFFYKPEYDDGSHLLQYGLIAEDVAKIYPGLVVFDNDGRPQTVRYHLLTPMLLNELQKQHALSQAQQVLIRNEQQEITRQKTQIATQQQQIEALQDQNAEFRQRLLKMEEAIQQLAKSH